MTGDPLARVKRAEKRRAAAEAEYRAALLEAADIVGYAELARYLGTTRQAVRQLLERWRDELEREGVNV